MGDTLCSLLLRGQRVWGHSLPPYKKGSKCVGDTLCSLIRKGQRVWGHSLPPYKGSKSVGDTRFYL